MKFTNIITLTLMALLVLFSVSTNKPLPRIVESAKAQSANAGQPCTTTDGKKGIFATSGQCNEDKSGQNCTTADNKAGATDVNGQCVSGAICGALPDKFCQTVVSAPADPRTNPLGGLKPIVEGIANILIGLYGIFAVFVLVASGVQLSASAGNETAVKSAKGNVLKVVTGLVLLISSRAILEIINNVFKGVNTTGSLFEASGTSIKLADRGIPLIIGNIISIMTFLSGIVAVVFIVVGGIRLITSGGVPAAISGARKTIAYAIGGLVLSISAYGILVFIQSQLLK